MLRFLASFFIAISLLVAPVSACLGDLTFADAGHVPVKADLAKAAKGESKHALNHHCCTAHAHHGNEAPSYQFDHQGGPDDRVLPLADALLTSRGPSPLFEPPARS